MISPRPNEFWELTAYPPLRLQSASLRAIAWSQFARLARYPGVRTNTLPNSVVGDMGLA